MKKINVVMSCDDNPFYYQFWNSVSFVWKNIFEINPILIYISNEENKTFQKEYGDVIRIPKLNNFPIYLQAQLGRIFYSSHYENEICLLSDIDIIPISKEFFNKELIFNSLKENSFFHLNPIKREFGQYPMCYYVGEGSTYKKLLNGVTWENFVKNIIKLDFNAKKLGYTLPKHLNNNHLWFSDELYLHTEIKKMNINILLNDKIITDDKRLDRENLLYYNGNISNNFIDCHLPRPYYMYDKQINYLISKLEDNE